MKKILKAGLTDQTIDVFIQDSTSTTGAGKTGLAYNTASLTCYYRKGATGSATQLTLATQTVGGAHSDGGFVEIDATNMPGMYRLDLSDTIVATAGTVSIMLKGATGMAPLPIELQIIAADLDDAAALGLSRVDATISSRASQASVDTVDTNVDAILVDTGTDLPATLTTIAGYLDTEVAAIKAKTDQLAFTGGRVDAVLSVTFPTNFASLAITAGGAVTVGTNNDKTGYSLANGAITAAVIATDAIDGDAIAASAVAEITSGLSTLDAAGVRAAVGLASANLDTQLGTIDTVVDAILVDTGTDLPATLTTIAGYLDTEIAAIKAKTDLLPASFPTNFSAMLIDAGGNVAADLQEINGDATSADNLAKTTRAIARGTAAGGASTTSIPTSAFTPAGAAVDQFKGRIVTFDADTATVALRGQSTDITASSNAATPTLTVTALTTAPAAGDTFSIT
jgi:cell division protein ZapA (FtsZ GTPase activity inhibitor)